MARLEGGLGRFGDYQAANFKAATDFKVGEAVRHLRRRGCEVAIFYKASADRLGEERDLLAQARQEHIPLLNGLPGYDYQTADEDEELQRVRDFVNKVILAGR
ncbi:MAG: hypothetical protein IRZ06_09575 [Nevskia sp.]|nr:hypothetical protein [Nevskia sp.]